MTDPFHNLPKNHYGAILADPPWAFQTFGGPAVPTDGPQPYKTMPIGQIKALPVQGLAASDCSLFIWITWPTMLQAIEVIDSWGFKYKTCAFCWLKGDPYRLFALEEDVYMGMGYWTRGNSEVCLLATRGKPKRLNADVRQGILAPRREHSRKPDGVHERIERLVAGPYLELFARQRRPNWDCWGNQTDKFAEAS